MRTVNRTEAGNLDWSRRRAWSAQVSPRIVIGASADGRIPLCGSTTLRVVAGQPLAVSNPVTIARQVPADQAVEFPERRVSAAPEEELGADG